MQDKAKKQELAAALGKAVSKLKQEANLSARTISYEMNISKTTVLLAEKGKLDPQLSTFFKLSEAVYKQPDEMLRSVMKELPSKWFQNEE